MDSSHNSSERQRALPEAIVALRAGKRAAAPIGNKLIQWHARAAYLGAAANHRIIHGLPVDETLLEVRELASTIVKLTDEWRAGLTSSDPTGRVADVERGVRSILATLDALVGRLAK